MVGITEQRGAKRILHAGLLVVCAVLLLAVPFLFDRGIDLTDEGSYLNSIATPGLYLNSLSPYGFFYHPLLIASDYNIVLLRVINYVALVVLTLILVIRATYTVGIERLPNWLARIGLWFGFTTSALFFYCIWLPTPSYNSLNVCGALLLAYALVGVVASDRLSVRDIVIAGVALSLCALTKPTTGAALAVLLLASTFGARLSYVLSIFAVGLFSAILCCAFFLSVFGSAGAVIHFYHEGVSISDRLIGGRSAIDYFLWRSFPFPFERLYAFLVCGIAVIIFFATELRSRFGAGAVLLWLAAFSVLVALCIWTQFFVDWWNRPLNWTPVLFAIVIALCGVARSKTIHTQHLRVALLLLAIPFAIGLGSGTGMLRSTAQAAAIWSVASLFILATAFDRENLWLYSRQVAISSVIAVTVVLAWAIYLPQRQVAPLWAQHTWTSAHGRGRALRVDSGTAAYFRDLGSAAQANGFTDETDVIDLTGEAPATIYVLGGNAIGSAYFSGGWVFSEWMVENALRPLPHARLERAWVLTRVKDSNTIDPGVLRRLGLDFPYGYRPVGQAVSPTEAGEQTLWKPKGLDSSIRSSARD